MRIVTMMAVALLLPALALGQFGGFGGSATTPGFGATTPGFNGTPVSTAKTPATAMPRVIGTPRITTPRRGGGGPVTSPTVMGVPLPDERVRTRPRAGRRRGKC